MCRALDRPQLEYCPPPSRRTPVGLACPHPAPQLPPQYQSLRRMVDAENKLINESRKIVTCDCVGSCVPETCICIKHGIRCFHDGGVPCACMEETVGCENPLAPDSYNEASIRLHYRRVLEPPRASRLRLENAPERPVPSSSAPPPLGAQPPAAAAAAATDDRSITGRKRISAAGQLGLHAESIAEESDEEESASIEAAAEAQDDASDDPDFDLSAAKAEALVTARIAAEAAAAEERRAKAAKAAKARKRAMSQRHDAPAEEEKSRRSARASKRRRPLAPDEAENDAGVMPSPPQAKQPARRKRK